jgi:hypothetical protein
VGCVGDEDVVLLEFWGEVEWEDFVADEFHVALWCVLIRLDTNLQMKQTLLLPQHTNINGLHTRLHIILPLAIPTIVNSRILLKHLIELGCSLCQTGEHNTRAILLYHCDEDVSVVVNCDVGLLGD